MKSADKIFQKNISEIVPFELFAYQIKNSSNQGDIVYDSFGGSGTTMLACEQLGRKARLMELDPRYVDVIIKRWEMMSGKKAVLKRTSNKLE